MKILKPLVSLIFLSSLVVSCGGGSAQQAQDVVSTAAAATVAHVTTLTREAQLSATFTPTLTPTDTPDRTATAKVASSETAAARPTNTPRPSATASNTPAPVSPTPSPRPTSTRGTPPTPAPTATPKVDFVTTVTAMKSQIASFGGTIDLAVDQGFLDCDQLVVQYLLIAAAPVLTVPPELEGANALYRQGVDKFVDTSRDIFLNCSDPNSSGEIPYQQWSNARAGVDAAVNLLQQAITAAGG